MGQPTVLKFTDFDFKRIKFKSPVKNPDRHYVCAASLDSPDGELIFIQTPEMQVGEFQDIGGKKHACVDLQISDDAFYQLLRFIDSHIVQHVFKHREAWFQKDINMADVEDCYKSPIQKTSNGPSVRMKLNTVESQHHTTYFVNKKEACIDLLGDHPSVIAIVQLKGLILNKGSINPDWVIHMLKSQNAVSRTPKFPELQVPSE